MYRSIIKSVLYDGLFLQKMRESCENLSAFIERNVTLESHVIYKSSYDETIFIVLQENKNN